MSRLKSNLRRLAGIAVAGALSIAAFAAQAQNWPNRPIKLLVPYAAGGSTDILARTLAERLAESTGTPVVVENRGGAAGSIGAAMFAKAALDDHWFMLVTPSQLSINQHIYKSVGYDPETELVPVGLVVHTTNAIVVNQSFPAGTFQEFIQHAQKNPTRMNYSSAGIGSTGHLLNELFKNQANFQAVHVPYKGNGPAMQALVGNEVEFNTDNMPQLIPQIRAGRLRPLAVTSEKRWFQLPDVPTVAELGFPQLTTMVWFGVVAQAKVSKDVIDRMNQELRKVLAQPEMIARLRERGLDPIPSTPEAMRDLAAQESVRWKKVVEVSGAKAE